METGERKSDTEICVSDAGYPKVYMAGLYEPVEDGYRYTILTTDANSSVDIHDRMPVVLRYPDECKAWLRGRIGPEYLCDRRGIQLIKAAI